MKSATEFEKKARDIEKEGKTKRSELSKKLAGLAIANAFGLTGELTSVSIRETVGRIEREGQILQGTFTIVLER